MVVHCMNILYTLQSHDKQYSPKYSYTCLLVSMLGISAKYKPKNSINLGMELLSQSVLVHFINVFHC